MNILHLLACILAAGVLVGIALIDVDRTVKAWSPAAITTITGITIIMTGPVM